MIGTHIFKRDQLVAVAEKSVGDFSLIQPQKPDLRPQIPRQLAIQPEAQPEPDATGDEPKTSFQPSHEVSVLSRDGRGFVDVESPPGFS